MKFTPQKPAIYGETLNDLKDKLSANGHPNFRAQQICDWLYKKHVTTWQDMVNIPKNLRDWLAESYTLMPMEKVVTKGTDDITQKLLFRLEDQSHIETVVIRYPQRGVGQDKSNVTICVSTQVGCAYGCKFCASGLDGWKRDLSAGEIVGQLIQVCHFLGAGEKPAPNGKHLFDNIVIMGMGEPLANYDNLMTALNIANADWGLRFGARRITVSTSGLVKQIRKLAEEPIQFRLAISLHGATDEVRSQIMPINRRYPLAELIPAAKHFTEVHGQMLTLEYILIEEINDMRDQAQELAKIAKEIHAHVNLIPYNTVEGLPWKRPNIKRQQTFFNTLKTAGVSVTIRKEKGNDIDAACGQLRLKQEKIAE